MKEGKISGAYSTHRDMKSTYKIIDGKPQGNTSLGERRRRSEDSIKIGLKEIGCEELDWIHLAQDSSCGLSWKRK
jgi:hypothetical protein